MYQPYFIKTHIMLELLDNLEGIGTSLPLYCISFQLECIE